MLTDQNDPLAEYQRRLDDRRSVVQELERRNSLFANLRLTIFIIGLVFAAGIFLGMGLHWTFLAGPLAAFVALAIVHDRLLRRKQHAEAAVEHYERAIARVNDAWAGTGIQGEDLMPENHLYARDLDLFGKGSLFELLCTTRTKAGEEVLADWLCKTPTCAIARSRQEAVRELQDRLDLREELAVLGNSVRAAVRPRDLVAWALAPPKFTSPISRILSYVLTAAAVGSLSAWFIWGTSILLFVGVLIVEAFYLRFHKGAMLEVAVGIQNPDRELRVLSHLLYRLEKEEVTAPTLVRLQEKIGDSGTAGSALIRQLSNYVQRLDHQRNPMFAPIGFMLLWPVHFTFAIERWRSAHGCHIEAWLEAVGEFETLCALAAFAYEHPKFPFPEINEETAEYSAKKLGHPLIAASSRVYNDVTLRTSPQALLVSGSNMSGKSTLLRTVGVNAVLAHVGAPVCATQLRMCPVSIGATLSIHDSIQEGASRFYAEITRLRYIVDLIKSDAPVLFLLDEILAGTNSHDRGIGAQAVVKTLLNGGGLGMVTTHDLSITKLVQEVGDRLTNVHFEDTLKGDRLVFDYTLRPGVVQKSNALALMRAVGLEL